MADTDILLSVDLDTKDALQTAKELGKEVEKSINSQKEASPQMSSFNAQLKQATIEAEKLGKQLEDVATKKIPTAEYTEIEKRLQKNNAQFDKFLIKQDEMQEMGKDSGSAWERLNVQMEQLGTLIREDEAEMRQLVADGKAFTLGKDSAEYTKLETQLDKVNDKTKILLLRKKELARKEGGAGGDASGGMAEAVTSIATGASKSLAILKVVGKYLKKTLLTVAAITLGVRGIMGIIRRIRRMVIEGFKAIYEGDTKLKKEVDALKKSWDEVKANLTAAFLPIIEIAIPYIQKLLDWLNLLLNKIAMFVAAIAGQNAYAKAIKKTGDAAASASKQLSKFDELNNLSSGSGAGSNFEIQKLPIDNKVLEMVEKLKALLKEIKDYFKENIFEPFKKGFESAIGDWQGKLEKLKSNIRSIFSQLKDIAFDPEILEAQNNLLQSFSRLVGEITGLFANLGMNIALAITSGIDDFLAQYKDEIKDDLVNMFTLETSVFDNFSQLADDLSRIVDTIGESESLADTFSNLLGIVYKLYSALSLVMMKLVDIASGTLATMIHNNVEGIKVSLEGVFKVLSKVTGFIEAVATTIKDILLRLVTDIIQPIFEGLLKPLLSDLLDIVLRLWVKIQPLLSYLMEELTELWSDYIDPILHSILDLVVAVLKPVIAILRQLWDGYLKPIVAFLIDAIGMLVPIIKMNIDAIIVAIKLIIIIVDQLLKCIKDAVNVTVAVLNGDWKGAWESAKQYVLDLFVNPLIRMIDLVKKHAEKWWAHLKELGWNLLMTLARLVESMGNILVSGINDVIIRAVNAFINAANLIPGVDFDTLSPIEKINFNLPTIPALAQGTVIPPSMGDFIARLGDNNRETEIVSPLSTMKQAMIEAMQEVGMSGGGDINIELTVDGKTLARTVVRQNDIYKKQTGRSLFTT